MSVSVSVSVSVQCSYSWCIIAKQKQMQENLLLAHHDLVTRANQVAANLPMRSMRNGFSCDYDWGASPFRGKIVWTNGFLTVCESLSFLDDTSSKTEKEVELFSTLSCSLLTIIVGSPHPTIQFAHGKVSHRS